jgi:hypothetical protein
VDGLDEFTLLTRVNSTGPHHLDIPAHPLKVDTQVGILAGLPAGLPDNTEAYIVSRGR